ncbi:ABC transporter substrate-binding protein [Actinotignum urinale]|uniref:ABC transporter substrate-binding protein n=1 Tax=Actinotignum urinale TaxID=190146 RepID=A0AAW9HYQ6_9ACTO|nr:ABC transporter substrate-binding protein [Actinotignum urinale]MDY5128487.1 ABC transporter substrate-binding protein [Actinotignum urinale]MDY5132677.1 ABC transporter substrate-binding protein [Actinotignum urinale]MDY5151231.1 ABC transporter substrate-binding protein [Actinotignum urinale]MDY5155149.1 ABC transporter substrate-binding protein [Actinotignum urinale]MDY5160576.1 ABC transporter substrate-binding protein [Actinotignum urinale]
MSIRSYFPPLRRNSSTIIFLGFLLSITLLLTSCAFHRAGENTVSAQPAPLATGQPAKGGTIRAAVAYTDTNLNPDTATSTLAVSANWHVVEGLYELDMHTHHPYRGLAKADSLKKVSDTEYEVTIRKNPKFSTGKPVTMHDIVASFERSLKPNNVYHSLLNFIDKVEAKDDTTLTIHLNRPFTLMKQRLALVKITPASQSEEERNTKPIGSGPWAYDSISPTSITFRPNEHYSGIYPATADRMEWLLLKDSTARATAFEKKHVDVMESVPGKIETQLKNTGATIKSVQGFNAPFLMFNTRKTPFNDARVRQAFFYAINTKKLIEKDMDSTASPTTSLLPQTHKNHHRASNIYTYDPDKARELLAQAGVHHLSVTLLASDHPWISALVRDITHDLEAVGITVSVDTKPSEAIYSSETDIENPTYDVVLAPGDPSVFGTDPDLMMNWWYGDNMWTQKRTGWKASPKFDELHKILRLASTKQNEEQQEEWNKALNIISEEVPLYPLFHRHMVTAFRDDKVTNFAPISSSGLTFVNAGADGEKEK